jgi:uncharacterized protein YcnI
MAIFKTPDGKNLKGFTKIQLKKECLSQINFWKKQAKEIGWKIEAKKNLKFWRFLLKQT